MTYCYVCDNELRPNDFYTCNTCNNAICTTCINSNGECDICEVLDAIPEGECLSCSRLFSEASLYDCAKCGESTCHSCLEGQLCPECRQEGVNND